ncbi:hypothetical protein J3D52_004450 [Achromobacter insolitus]|nr:hypothetical protein [Achromobacter insolitus]
MSPTHIWVLEVRHYDEWRFYISRTTRKEARLFQLQRFAVGESRIRKYVPA